MTPTFMRRGDAANYLQARCGLYTAGTLAKLACVGGGPRYRKLGHFPVYTQEDLDNWIEGRLSTQRTSTCG